MRIQVLFFGATADISGTRTLELFIEEDQSSDLIIERMVKRFPALASHKLYLSINQRYAAGNEVMQDGDEVAIFTAVSGG